MTKLRLAIAGLVAVVVTLVASPAMAYPDPIPGNFGGSASDGAVGSGQPITLSGDFDGVDCTTWVATLNPVGLTQTGSGPTFSVSFPAQPDGTYSISLACEYVNADGEVANAAFSYPVVVGDAAPAPTTGPDTDNGALPNTGGSSLWLAVAAAALVIAGATTYTVRRRTA